MKVLFVCRGNVGRSQMAEVVFNQITGNIHEVLSAGRKVVQCRWRSRHGQKLKDLPAAENVIVPLKEKGVAVSEYTRTQLDPSMVEEADKIVVMSEPEHIPEYLSASPKMEYWDVKDPKGTTLDEHRNTLNQIEILVKNFIKQNSL